jgi:PAS domain S-box-containing protein/putative nucleotidyltransferase with HDIG domain
MNKSIRILHLEDDAKDAEIIQVILESAGIVFQITRVQNGIEFAQAIQMEKFDVILADYRLPGYDGIKALKLALELCPDTPFIFVSGTMGEDIAIECLTQGATDYVLKLKLSRLVPAIKRALSEAENLGERKRVESNLRLQSAALEAAANGIVITNDKGIITWVNPAFTQLTGYTAEETIGQNPRILKSGKHAPEFYGEIWKTILSGQVWHGEIINRRADGTFYTEEMTIAPVCQEQGEISHFVAIKQDISNRKQYEMEREAIISVANAMRTATTRFDLVDIFLNRITELFNADGSMLVIQNKVVGGVVVEMGCGPVGERFTGLHIPPGKGICCEVFADGKLYLNNYAHTDPLFFRSDLLGDSHAVACVPLIAQNEMIGALWVIRKEVIAEKDINLLVAIANLAANAIHRVTLHEQTVQQLHQMASLHQIDLAISSIFDLRVILDILLKNAVTQLGIDAANVLLLIPDTRMLEYVAGYGFKTSNIETLKVLLGEGRAGTAASERRILSLSDLSQAQDAFSRTVLISEEKFVSHHVAPLIAKGQVKGVLEVFCRKRLDPTPEWFDFFESLATQAAIAIDNTTLFNQLHQSNIELTLAYDATIEGWSRALDMRDKETEGHTQRVTDMVLHLAARMGMDMTDLLEVRRGALLHDIGKMGIPDSILLKPDKLSKDEWEIMRRHPVFAYEMLAPISYLKEALDIPYCHHEKWDGSGYPRGLKGNQIPLAARIFAIVDVWDAITSDRPYRAALSREKALAYIQDQSGKHFDPGVVTIFLDEMNLAPR